MFLLDKKDVTLCNLTTRTEKNGDEDVPAVSLKLEYTTSNKILDLFHPDMLESFYKRRSDPKQPALIKDDLFPDLIFNKLKPIIWDEEYPGYRLRIIDEINHTQAVFILSDCMLKKFVFEMKEGGSVTMTWTLNCNPDGEQVGWLYDAQKHNMLISLDPPSAEKLKQMAANDQDRAA